MKRLLVHAGRLLLRGVHPGDVIGEHVTELRPRSFRNRDRRAEVVLHLNTETKYDVNFSTGGLLGGETKTTGGTIARRLRIF